MKHPLLVPGLVQPEMPATTLPCAASGPARERVALPVVGHGGVPDHLAGMRIERHEMSVGRGEQHFVVVERDGAAGTIKQIVVIAAFDLRQLAPILPQQIPAAPVERLHDILGVGEEQNAVMRQRRFFLIAGLHVPGPGQPQPSDILRVDLVEGAEAPSGEIAAPHQPIVRCRFGERGVSDRLERMQKIVAGECARRSAKQCQGTERANQRRPRRSAQGNAPAKFLPRHGALPPLTAAGRG